MNPPLYSQDEGVLFTNPNGQVIPCFVTSVTPTVNGMTYAVIGDLNDPNFPVGAAYGPFQYVPEAQLSLRATTDQTDTINDVVEAL
jgi:hypothetical protein